MKIKYIFFITFLSFILISCTPNLSSESKTATVTKEFLRTITPIFTPTNTPSPTDIVTLTPSITNTITDTAFPFSTLTPTITLPYARGSDCIPTNTERVLAYLAAFRDGDTIRVYIDGKLYDVQYLGVDAPELGDDFSWNIIWFAKYFNEYWTNVNLDKDEPLILIKDISDVDAEGRLLRYVIAGNSFMNYEMIWQGMAMAATLSPPDISCDKTFREAEMEAKTNGINMWKSTETSTPQPKTIGD